MSATTPTQDATAAGSSSEAQAAEPEVPPPPPTPPFPFSKNPQADLVIKGADGVEFQVIKAILAAASPVFDDMFTVAQPSQRAAANDDDDDDDDSETEALPTVDVTEDSTTLEHLLRFCYPVPNPALPSLAATAAVLEAARKYAVAAAQAGCAAHLARLAPASPARAMQVYALACLFGRESLARAAAPHTLGLSLDALLTGAFPEAETLPFACVQRLAAFRRECAAALAPLAAPAHWIVDPRQAAQGQGQGALAMPWVRPRTDKPNACCEEVPHERRGLWGNVETMFVKKWWWEYMNEVAVALAHVDKDGRLKSAEADARDRAVTSAVLCETCRPAAFREFKVFEEKLQLTLDAAVTKAAAKHYFTTKAPTRPPQERRETSYLNRFGLQ